MSEQRRDVDFYQATIKGNVLGGNSLFTSKVNHLQTRGLPHNAWGFYSLEDTWTWFPSHAKLQMNTCNSSYTRVVHEAYLCSFKVVYVWTTYLSADAAQVRHGGRAHAGGRQLSCQGVNAQTGGLSGSTRSHNKTSTGLLDPRSHAALLCCSLWASWMGGGSFGVHFTKAYQAVPAMLCIRMQFVDPWDSPMAAQIGKQDAFPGPEWLF